LEYSKFGWNGLLFNAPKEARFNRFGGNIRGGLLRLEAERFFIEAKWEPLPKKRRPISAVADRFVEDMAKEYGKKLKRPKKSSFEIAGKENARVSTHDALYLAVQAQVKERYYMWYCEESNRTIILRFVFQEFDSSAKQIMKNVLDGFECHSEKTSVWMLLNMRFEAPVEFLLSDAKIAAGRAFFMLVDRKLSSFSEKASSIVVEYFSMANVIYKDTYKELDKWFEEHYEKELKKQLKKKRLKFQVAEPQELRKHGVVVHKATEKSGVSWRAATLYTNSAWYCPKANRIYSVTVSSKTSRPFLLKKQLNSEEHAKLVADILSSFKCH
jgi:hypothetical protein